jgi:hypothetical protein
MFKKLIIIIFALGLVLWVLSLFSQNSLKEVNIQRAPEDIKGLATTTKSINKVSGELNTNKSPSVIGRGDRSLGLGATFDSTNNYETSFNMSKDLGSQFEELPLPWDDIEKSPNKLDSDFVKIANIYYPKRNTKIALNISPIDTNNVRLPKDLKGKKFNDKEVVDRYKKAVDYVLGGLSDVSLLSFSVGNEVDNYLNNHNDEWPEYIDFYRQISSYIKSKNPNAVVGVKMTYDGLMKYDEADNLNKFTDAVFVTYYPLDSNAKVKDPSTVSSDFRKLVSKYNNKPIYILEAGYPSGSSNDSSEEMQSKFIENVFTSWDENISHIKAISFIALNDSSPKTASDFSKYYGISNRAFLSFLSSLGLRTYDGGNKSSYYTFKREASLRGW